MIPDPWIDECLSQLPEGGWRKNDTALGSHFVRHYSCNRGPLTKHLNRTWNISRLYNYSYVHINFFTRVLLRMSKLLLWTKII